MGLEDQVVEVAATVFGLCGCEVAERFGSSNNANLRLAIRGRGDVVARVYPPTTSVARVHAIQAARIALHDAGLPYVRPIAARSGETIAALPGGSTLELEDFVSGDDMESLEQIVLAMPRLGRTHAVLSGHPTSYAGRYPPFSNHVAAYAITSLTRQLVRRADGWGDPELAVLARRADDLAQAIATAGAGLLPGHQQLVHGDFWNNNVLFVDDRVTIVLDLDFMGFRPRIDDLALTLYYTRSDYVGPFDQAERLRWLASIVAAYDSGLDDLLTAEERRALPFALARTTLYGVRYIAADVNEGRAKDRLRGDARDVDWALDLVHTADEWQDAFV